MTTMTDIEMSASHAAAYLAAAINDGRDYGLLLADQRRGRRVGGIPFHRGAHGRVHYYKSDLDGFVSAELSRSLVKKHMKRVERVEGAVGAMLPPSKVVAIIP